MISDRQNIICKAFADEGLAHQAGHLTETDGLRHFHKSVDRSAVRGGDRVVEWEDGAALGFEECDQQVSPSLFKRR